MAIPILHQHTGVVLYTSDKANSLGEATVEAMGSGADLSRADLSYADLSRADLSYADLSHADLSYANLSGAQLSYAGLSRANLSGAQLGGADFMPPTSWTKKADPELPGRIAAQVLNGGTLEMSAWHSCETTHCLAGWAIHLSGRAGYLLEEATSPSVAGAMLIPRAAHLFYATNDEALEWLKAQLAEAA